MYICAARTFVFSHLTLTHEDNYGDAMLHQTPHRADTQATDRELQQRLIDLLLMHPGGGPAHSGTSTDASKASAQGPSAQGPSVEAPVATAGPCAGSPAAQEHLLESLLRGALDRRITHAQAAVAAARAGTPHALGMLRRGVALLHLVAALGYDWAIERLLVAGADIDVRVRERKAACCCEGIAVALARPLIATRLV